MAKKTKTKNQFAQAKIFVPLQFPSIIKLIFIYALLLSLTAKLLVAV